MFLLRKLSSVFRQQYLGALALFVALGGSAYAAASITGANVVDDSLTTADIKGRPASPGKPATLGTITRADIAPGATMPNSAKLGGVLPAGYGVTVRSSHQQTSDCLATAGYNQCAKVTVVVPAGKHYRAGVYSSVSAWSNGGGYLYYCPALKSATLALTCLTGTPPPGGDYVSFAPNVGASGAASGDTSGLGFNLGQGTWTFSTQVLGTGATFGEVHTTVVVTDVAAPQPSGVTGSSGSSGTCDTSSGASSGASGGTSGNTSGGTSGNTSGGTSGGTSSGASGGTSSGGTSGNTSGGTSGSSGSSGTSSGC